MGGNMLVINQLAEIPKDFKDYSEIIRAIVQSLATEEINTINFLVSIWSFYLHKGYLTEKQKEALLNIVDDFIRSVKIQFSNKKFNEKYEDLASYVPELKESLH